MVICNIECTDVCIYRMGSGNENKNMKNKIQEDIIEKNFIYLKAITNGEKNFYAHKSNRNIK